MTLFKYLEREDSDNHIHNVYDDIIHCEAPPPNSNSANIFLWLVWDQTIKFKDRQYYRLYGSFHCTYTPHMVTRQPTTYCPATQNTCGKQTKMSTSRTRVLASLEERSPVSKPLDKFTSSTSLDSFYYHWRHVYQFPGRLLVFYCIHKVQNLHRRTMIETVHCILGYLDTEYSEWWHNQESYEANIEENEVKRSAVTGNWTQNTWLELPVLCHWAMTKQPPASTILWLSGCRISATEHRQPKAGVLGSILGSSQTFHFPLFLLRNKITLIYLSSHYSHLLLKSWSVEPFVSLHK